MHTLTIASHDEDQRLALEPAIAYVSNLPQLAIDAPAGSVRDACEEPPRDKGRALLRSTRAAAGHSRIAWAERKGGPHVSAPSRTPNAPRVHTGEPS